MVTIFDLNDFEFKKFQTNINGMKSYKDPNSSIWFARQLAAVNAMLEAGGQLTTRLKEELEKLLADEDINKIEYELNKTELEKHHEVNRDLINWLNQQAKNSISFKKLLDNVQAKLKSTKTIPIEMGESADNGFMSLISQQLGKSFKSSSEPISSQIITRLEQTYIRLDDRTKDLCLKANFNYQHLQSIKHFLLSYRDHQHYMSHAQEPETERIKANIAKINELLKYVAAVIEVKAKETSDKNLSQVSRREIVLSDIASPTPKEGFLLKPGSVVDKVIANLVTRFVLQKPKDKMTKLAETKQEFLKKYSDKVENIFIKDNHGSRLDAIHYQQSTTVFPAEQKYIIPLAGVGNSMEAMLTIAKQMADETSSNFLAFNYNGRCDSGGEIADLNTALTNTQAAIDYLLAIGVKPENIYLVGHSHGAAIAKKAAAQNDDKVNFVSINGYTNLNHVVEGGITQNFPRLFGLVPRLAKIIAGRVERALQRTNADYNLTDNQSHANGFYIYTAGKGGKESGIVDESIGHEYLIGRNEAKKLSKDKRKQEIERAYYRVDEHNDEAFEFRIKTNDTLKVYEKQSIDVHYAIRPVAVKRAMDIIANNRKEQLASTPAKIESTEQQSMQESKEQRSVQESEVVTPADSVGMGLSS